MTNKEKAAGLNISEKYYYQLTKKPGFPPDGNWEQVQAWYADYRHTIESVRGSSDLRGELLREQAELTRVKREQAELELRKMERSLVPLDEARDAISKVLRPLRLQLDALPSRLAHELNKEDPALAEQVLRDALEAIYAELGTSLESAGLG